MRNQNLSTEGKCTEPLYVFKINKLYFRYSLFSEIPTNRTCEQAGITSHWCTCQQSVEVSSNNSQVIEAATFTVSYINSLLKGYAECAVLKFDRILTARLLYHEGEHIQNSEDLKDFTIVFGTVPGNAVFEVTNQNNIGILINIIKYVVGYC